MIKMIYNKTSVSINPSIQAKNVPIFWTLLKWIYMFRTLSSTTFLPTGAHPAGTLHPSSRKPTKKAFNKNLLFFNETRSHMSFFKGFYLLNYHLLCLCVHMCDKRQELLGWAGVGYRSSTRMWRTWGWRSSSCHLTRRQRTWLLTWRYTNLSYINLKNLSFPNINLLIITNY